MAAPAFAYAPSEFSAVSPAPFSRERAPAESAGAGGRRSVAGRRGGLGTRSSGGSGKAISRRTVEQVSLALVNKGKALGGLGRAEEALAVLDGVVRRFGTDNGDGHSLAVATALAGKGGMLSSLNRHTEALADVEGGGATLRQEPGAGA